MDNSISRLNMIWFKYPKLKTAHINKSFNFFMQWILVIFFPFSQLLLDASLNPTSYSFLSLKNKLKPQTEPTKKAQNKTKTNNNVWYYLFWFQFGFGFDFIFKREKEYEVKVLT